MAMRSHRSRIEMPAMRQPHEHPSSLWRVESSRAVSEGGLVSAVQWVRLGLAGYGGVKSGTEHEYCLTFFDDEARL
jgi:hypothetical protein